MLKDNFNFAKKPLLTYLTQTYGLGNSTAQALCLRFGLAHNLLVGRLPPFKLYRLKLALDREFTLEAKLRYNENEAYKRLSLQNCYRGRRLAKGLPVRGQRTHSNANTSFKLRFKYRLSGSN